MEKEKRLIDANALQRRICGAKCGCEYEDCGCEGDCQFDFFISSAATVDAKEILHGNWHIDKSFMPFISTCSECGSTYDIDGAFDWNYCPCCGAKMDGVQE